MTIRGCFPRLLRRGAAWFALAGLVTLAGCCPCWQFWRSDAETAPLFADVGCYETPTLFPAIAPAEPCDKCRGHALPGRLGPNPDAAYTIWSDLPEVFCSTGVLYATTLELPADENGAPPADMRIQESAPDFDWIDGSFEVFVFHTVYHCKPASAARRVVIYARNEGDGPVEIEPRQIISTEGEIGRSHKMESELGARVLGGLWDRPVEPLVIAPGAGAVVGYSKRFGADAAGPDSSREPNCFGTMRARVNNPNAAQSPTRLRVFVVAIDAAPAEENLARAEALLGRAAVSGDTIIDMTTPPSGCAVRRATGVFRSFIWRNDPVVIDAANLEGDGLAFLMANWANGAAGCPETRQTADMALHPPYTRPDTIGNYHVVYRLNLRLVNSDTANARAVDLRFGKHDADVGLAWRVAADPDPARADSILDGRPVRTGWAGPKQDAAERSFLAEDGGPITLRPCEAVTVGLTFLVVGNSSLPLEMRVVAPPIETFERVFAVDYSVRFLY